MKNISIELSKFSQNLLPRILTQVCRDSGHPAYGSFDRNWWHYKIRDFASIVLQQGGLTLLSASTLAQHSKEAESLKLLAKASCIFWNTRAKNHGSFEEYYPWEEGYPAVAFSTLAIAKMCLEGIIPVTEIADGLKIATTQLISRFEPKASNQQVAGMTALCLIRKIAPDLIDESKFKILCNKTLACQHKEGWYIEYGGPDLGYLTVTIDCLWDAYDATGDIRFIESARRALHFIVPFIQMPQRGAGMFNARNTDYILPYGISRFLEDSNDSKYAEFILTRVFRNFYDNPDHFLHAIDDRYLCHYIGHSIFKSLPLLKKVALTQEIEKKNLNTYFEGTGQWLRSDIHSNSSTMIGAKKGGILSLSFGTSICSDYGWIAKSKDKEWVSHWYGDFWKIQKETDSILIIGHLTPHKENNSTPLKHILLRCLSLCFGKKIIRFLKEKMIFKEHVSAGFKFSRKITFKDNRIITSDTIHGVKKEQLKRAPRSSKRHVASADSYHTEDLNLQINDISINEKWRSEQSKIFIETVYQKSV